MPCTDKNPLLREGTSLLNRVLAALSASYAKVDEREAADIVLFAKRYAACLNYFKDDNTADGSWQVLMQADVSVSLATLSRIDMQEISAYKKRVYKNIKLAGTDADAKKSFRYLFDLFFSLATLVDKQYQLLPDDFEYKNIFRDVIINKLELPLANLAQRFTDFKFAGLLDYTTTDTDNDSPIEVVSNENFTPGSLGAEWQGASAVMPITLPALPAAEVIAYIINHNLFNAQIELFFNGIAAVVQRSSDLFVQTLGDYPKHTPHFALFLAFIEIYKHEQDALNSYTQRHLDFYYKEVLRLMNKAPEPDAVHLLFELQKPVAEHRLIKNTLFKGGKDITGKEISYALTDDIILNKALVSKIHSLQIIHGSRDLLKGSPVANSDDGQGAKITAADKSWFTFGDPKKIGNAKTGFAIASNMFFLNEGNRNITITANFTNPVPGLANPAMYNLNCFTAQFTGKKKWEGAPAPVVSSNAGGTQLIFNISLTPDAPAVLPYDEKIHARSMPVQLPIVTIYLNQDAVNAIPYTLLCNQQLASVNIAVDVSGIKDLMLSNDNGSIDASKPFKPFGDFPATNAGFYIGSKEIFQKELSFIELETSWKTPPGNPVLSTTAHYLRQGDFETHSYAAVTASTTNSITFSGGNDAFIPTAISFEKNEKITANALEGFLRIGLNSNNYSLSTHMDNISKALSKTTLTGTSPNFTMVVPAAPVPVELVLNNFSVHYRASTNISFAANANPANHLFYQVSPFGFARVNNALVEGSPDTENTKRISLLQDLVNEGELYIGLENAAANMVVTILFQVAEGSSNPLRDMEILNWYYLAANNNWKKFRTTNIIDNTNNFTQSGIVILTLPNDAVNNNTLLEQGLHWIKITAHPYTDAVCKMILVQAQAAKVQLLQDDTRQVEFRQLLKAGSISKLLVSDSAIKKIEQPFDSFDGRTRESDDHFYVRVSERLRHKQRAITIWDYEHIILEKFPQIFKVKCLNHSGFYKQQGEEIFCENFPGHVSVVTVPNQNNNTHANPLRPYTPVGLLNNINNYLATIISPFVKLHVKNPQFEEIQLDFKVSFYEHLDQAFYLQLLNKEIEQFLCPWAFNNTTEISFGGKIYKSALLNFVEERPYVDFVTCFKMNQFINRGSSNATSLLDIEEATASTGRSVLVSYFDEDTNIKHKIVSPATCTC